jgi:hypothetical protein
MKKPLQKCHRNNDGAEDAEELESLLIDFTIMLGRLFKHMLGQ